jgi:hypothetical protein
MYKCFNKGTKAKGCHALRVLTLTMPVHRTVAFVEEHSHCKRNPL